MDVHHGWFSDNKEWIEFIAAAVVLCLLMMTGISLFDMARAPSAATPERGDGWSSAAFRRLEQCPLWSALRT